HPFPSIAGNMIVYPTAHRIQQRRLTMEAAAHNQGNAGGNAHTFNGSMIWRIKCNLQGWGRLKFDRILFQWPVVCSASSGQDASICYKSDQVIFKEPVSDEISVFSHLNKFI